MTSKTTFWGVWGFYPQRLGAKAPWNQHKEMKINKIELIKRAPVYKGIVGTILNKYDEENFLVKTKDSFVKIVEYEYDGKIKVGDRFE